MTFYLIASAIILLDQATKQVIVRALRLGQGIAIIPGFFDIVFVLNPGAALWPLSRRSPCLARRSSHIVATGGGGAKPPRAIPARSALRPRRA